MSIWDDRILEYIQENEGGSVGEMGDCKLFRISKTHVSRRAKKLSDHGLLRALGNGVYVITDEGERYLSGDLDAEDMPDTSNENGTAEA